MGRRPRDYDPDGFENSRKRQKRRRIAPSRREAPPAPQEDPTSTTLQPSRSSRIDMAASVPNSTQHVTSAPHAQPVDEEEQPPEQPVDEEEQPHAQPVDVHGLAFMAVDGAQDLSALLEHEHDDISKGGFCRLCFDMALLKEIIGPTSL